MMLFFLDLSPLSRPSQTPKKLLPSLQRLAPSPLLSPSSILSPSSSCRHEVSRIPRPLALLLQACHSPNPSRTHAPRPPRCQSLDRRPPLCLRRSPSQGGRHHEGRQRYEGWESAQGRGRLSIFTSLELQTMEGRERKKADVSYSSWCLEGVESLQVLVDDIESADILEHLEGVIEYIREGIKKGGVLVHCVAGMVCLSIPLYLANLAYNQTLTGHACFGGRL
jgi:hypothetical protein